MLFDQIINTIEDLNSNTVTEDRKTVLNDLIEYIQLFYAKFEITVFEKCYNSIKPRQGREFFFIFEKK